MDRARSESTREALRTLDLRRKLRQPVKYSLVAQPSRKSRQPERQFLDPSETAKVWEYAGIWVSSRQPWMAFMKELKLGEYLAYRHCFLTNFHNRSMRLRLGEYVGRNSHSM